MQVITLALAGEPFIGKNLPVWVVAHSVDEDYPHNEQVRVTSFERIFFHLEQLRLLQY